MGRPAHQGTGVAGGRSADRRTGEKARRSKPAGGRRQPDVAPVSFEFDGTYFYVGGWAPERTRKFHNVKAGNAKVALVVDDLASVDPWTLRFLRVYRAADLVERQGQFG